MDPENLDDSSDPAYLPTNREGLSPFLQAVYAGSMNMVKIMINNGIDLDEADRNKHYCLHYAIWKKNLEMVKVLLESGALVNYDHPWNHCPLKSAVAVGDVDIVKVLIDFGANVNSSCGREHPTASTALHIGVGLEGKATRRAMVELLLAHGAHVNAADKLGRGILSTAIRCRSLNVIKLLILHGAKGDVAKNGMEHTPFQSAILNGNGDVVRLFLDEDLDLDLGSKKLLPLHLALRNPDKSAIKALLSSGRYDIDQKDEFGFTALHRSVQNASLKNIKTLLKRGAKGFSLNRRYQSTVLTAVQVDSAECVDLLLSSNMSLQVRRSFVNSCLLNPSHLPKDDLTLVVKRLIKEIALLYSQGCTSNLEGFQKFVKGNEMRKSFYEECLSELAVMEAENFYDLYTFHQFLTAQDNKPFSKSNVIVSIFRRTSYIEDRFPIYSDQLKMRYEQYWGKSQLREDAKQGLKRILKIDADAYHLVFSNILRRFRKKDLRNLRDV